MSRFDKLVANLSEAERSELARVLRRRGYDGHESGIQVEGKPTKLVLCKLKPETHVVLELADHKKAEHDYRYWIEEHTCPWNLRCNIAAFVTIEPLNTGMLSIDPDEHGCIRHVGEVAVPEELRDVGMLSDGELVELVARAYLGATPDD